MNMGAEPKRGIIYCRVSSQEQVVNTSLESQEKYCREYAKREGIEIVREPFVEKGESAKTANRTEFIKAINFCSDKKNKVTHFIVYKLDRFARNQNDHVITQATLRRYGVTLRSVTEPIDETVNGKLMEGIISVFAEFDNNVRTDRSKSGMIERIRKGIWVWQAPLGYCRKYKGANLSADPDNAPYIKLAFEEWSKGIHTYDSLAKYLASVGFKTKNGKPPIPQLLEKILKNPLYCGIMRVWNEEHKGAFDPIISEELFYSCQRGYKKKAVKVSRLKTNPSFPLRRACICSECNQTLTGSTSTGRSGMKYSYYHHHRQGCSKATSMPREAFEQKFVEYLQEITPNKGFEKAFKEIVLDIWQTNYKKLDEKNAKVREQIEKLEQDRQRVFDLHRTGKYSDVEFFEQKEIINSEITQKRFLIQENHIEEFDMDEALTFCFQFVGQSAKTWVRLRENNFEHLMRFQNQVFPEKITFDGEKFGNTKMSPVYRLNKEFDGKKSTLVTNYSPSLEPTLAQTSPLAPRGLGTRPVRGRAGLDAFLISEFRKGGYENAFGKYRKRAERG
jgi:DNA invertase Pin-like site-specific DNA recombinase